LKLQLYPRWELCIAYDVSTPGETTALLERYATQDPRIKVLAPAQHRRGAEPLSTALGSTTGEFIALVDTDDELSPDALARYVLVLNEHSHTDLIYCDEDRIDDAGTRSAPYFKPEWSPETLLASMYLGRLCVYRRSVIDAVGAFPAEMSDGVEYDAALRVTERTSRVRHIPHVLCHRRIRPEDFVSDTHDTGENPAVELEVLRRAIARRGLRGTAEANQQFRDHHVVRLAADPIDKVSIVIPTRDRPDLLERCLETVLGLTAYPNFEVCVVDNGSRESATFEVFRRFERQYPGRFRVTRLDIPFNFSTLVNAGVAATEGELIVLLNNDTEVLDSSWLEQMAGYAQRPEIGAVGCVLLYPNGTVQHGGVILMAGAVAGHSHAGQPASAPGYFGRLLAQSNYSAVTAACMMVRRKVFTDARGFDERLAVAYNDVDFCLRLLKSGFRNVCLGQVRLLHHESMSRGSDDHAERRARSVAESRLMRQRWQSILDSDPYYSPNLRSAPPDFSLAELAPRSPEISAAVPVDADSAAGSSPHWFGSSSPTLLVAGHSHRYAFIDYFNRSGQRAPVAILESTSSINADPDPYWGMAVETARERGLPLAVVWDGNQHNIHFLLESEERFSVFPATGPWEDGHRRPLMPRSLIREFFAPSLGPLRIVLAGSAGAKVVLIGTPPPKPDDHVNARIQEEALFVEAAERLGMTASTLRVTPLAIRVELWRITQEMLRALAHEFGTTFVGVPDRALSGGALAAELSYRDATHANGLWAELMIQETTGALATG
jgi:GT2 family glycosyltransferase